MLHLLLHILSSGALLLIVLGAASGYGALALSLLSLPQISRHELWLFALGLGLGALSLLVLLLGAVGLLYVPVIWVVLVAGMVLLPALLRAGRLVLPAPEPAASRKLWQDPTLAALALIIALPLGYTLFAHALVPPIDNDVVAYHFAIPKLYLEAHRLIYLPYILHSNWPLGAEMLFLIGLALGSEYVAQLITWAFAAQLCVAVVLFGRRWLSPGAGWVAAAALCSVPMVTRLAGTGMVEVPLACYTFLAFYALWHWRTGGAWGWLTLSALLAGCAAATKLNGATGAIVFGALAAGLLLLARRPARAAQAFVAYGLVSFLVVLPWYIKAWAFTGNPIWPFLYPVLGGKNWDALGSSYLIGYLHLTNMDSTFGNWLTGPWQATVANGRFGSYLLGFYGLGLLPLGLLPLVARPAQRPLLATLLLLTVIFYTIWFFLTHQTRFLFPTLPFALLFGAAGVAWIWETAPRSLSALARLALVAWLLAGAWMFDTHSRAVLQRGLPYLLGQQDREAFLTTSARDYQVFSYINAHLPPDVRVLMGFYEPRGYYLDRPYVWANPIGQRYLPLEQIATVDELRAELRRRGITHLLLNTGSLLEDIPHWDHISGLLNGLVSEHGRLLFEGGAARVYLLDDQIGAAP